MQNTADRKDVYSRITAQIVEQLEKGVRPRIRPWNAGHAAGRITRPLRFMNTGSIEISAANVGGDTAYASEELVAELGSAFLCADLELHQVPPSLEQVIQLKPGKAWCQNQNVAQFLPPRSVPMTCLPTQLPTVIPQSSVS